LNSNIFKFINSLNKFNIEFKNKKHRLIAYNDVFYNENLFITHFILHKDFLTSPYREIVLNYFINAENTHPGSAFLLSQLIVDNFFNKKSKNINITKKNKSNLIKYFNQRLNKKIVNDFINILDFSGPDAILNCEVTKNSQFTVEKVKFPNFSIKIHEDFDQVFFKSQDSSTKNYLTCLYDGYIERESEIFSLIEKSKSNNKCPILLVCRGISDNAIRSLKQILLKSNIFLYPYICKFDNTDPFALEDLSKVLEIKTHNIESGDNLHKAISENSDFRKLKLFSNKIQILSNSNILISEINDQIKKTNDAEVLKYLYKRKNRCSPNNVYIKIPQNKVKYLNDYKAMIKMYNNIAKNGLFQINNKLYSSRAYNKCIKLSNKFIETTFNIGYTIKVGDKNVS
jgi:hypothetical protein